MLCSELPIVLIRPKKWLRYHGRAMGQRKEGRAPTAFLPHLDPPAGKLGECILHGIPQGASQEATFLTAMPIEPLMAGGGRARQDLPPALAAQGAGMLAAAVSEAQACMAETSRFSLRCLAGDTCESPVESRFTSRIDAS